jgi:hypothetical protein
MNYQLQKSINAILLPEAAVGLLVILSIGYSVSKLEGVDCILRGTNVPPGFWKAGN